MEPTDRRIEANFSQGWPMALFITLLVVAAFVTAGTIHKKTFRPPRDTSAEYRKEATGFGAASAEGKAGR